MRLSAVMVAMKDYHIITGILCGISANFTRCYALYIGGCPVAKIFV